MSRGGHLFLVPPADPPLPPLQQFTFAWNGRDVFVWWNNDWVLARSCTELADEMAKWTARIISDGPDEATDLTWPLKPQGSA